jgi:Putative Actinobacterial Holin-X, holin superfamily III
MAAREEERIGVQAYSTSNDRSLGTLFADLMRETTTLVQQEVTLARTEASEKVSQLGNGLAALVIGGLVLFAGLLKLLDAVIYGLGGLMQDDLALWLPALIVGGIVAIIGVIMLQKGRRNLQPRNLAPQWTAESLQRDAELVKEHVR